ncbi:MAG: NfeD family protein [Chlamydiota bacterium]
MTTAFILLGIGFLAILCEFFLPGGIMGTVGALFILGSIVIFASNSDSLILTFGYIVITLVAFGLLVKFALWRIKHGKPGKTIYSDDDQEGFVASKWDRSLVGKDGFVSTDLKPGGHITIEGKQYSAISQSGYIPYGEGVTVIGGEGETLIVKQTTKRMHP